MGERQEAEIVVAIRELYEQNPDAKRLFDWVAGLRRANWETKVERISGKVNIYRTAAIELARALEEAGCGRFIVGRKGYESRFVWDYSPSRVGKVASGLSDDLGEGEEEGSEDVEEVRGLSIEEAKNGLAYRFGVEPDQISIKIRA